MSINSLFKKVINKSKVLHSNEMNITDSITHQQPILPELTDDEINDIHARRKITAKEKVQEWEDMGLCGPAIDLKTVNSRCIEFNHNCHDCLVDYVSGSNEYESCFEYISYNCSKSSKKDGVKVKKLER